MRTPVLIIGGGATGAGLAWDLSLRGVASVLIERNDLGSGTTGRCHGLLHSGARYVVNDPDTAAACAAECRVLKDVAGGVIEGASGLFVSLGIDPPDYPDLFLEGARRIGLRAEEIEGEVAVAREPLLARSVARAITTEDASIDPFSLVYHLVRGAARMGCEVRTHTELVSLTEGEAVVRGPGGSAERIAFDVCVNAAGPWAPAIAQLAGQPEKLCLSKGSMLVFAERLFSGVVHRLRPPGDGDIFVPSQTVTILGTSSVDVGDDELDAPFPGAEEIDLLMNEGRALCPHLDRMRLVRAFAGVRPILSPADSACPVDARSHSRGHAMHDGGWCVHVVGGKLSTFRLMAEEVADRVCRKLGEDVECNTRTTPIVQEGIPPARDRGWSARDLAFERAVSRHGSHTAELAGGPHPDGGPIICRCEGVRGLEVEEMVRQGWITDLGDLRRRTRLGNGNCQGTFCAPLAAGELVRLLGDDYDPVEDLRRFIGERVRGSSASLHIDQLRQLVLMKRVYAMTGGLEE